MDLAKARSFPLALVFSPGVIVGSLSHCRFHPASLLQEREKKVPMNEMSVLFLQQNNPRKCCDEGWASKPLPCNQGVCVVTIHLVHSQKSDFVHKFFASVIFLGVKLVKVHKRSYMLGPGVGESRPCPEITGKLAKLRPTSKEKKKEPDPGHSE